MKYTEKELNLAKRYANGDCNDVQLNYLISTNNLDQKKVELLINFCKHSAPFVTFCWVVLLFYVFHLSLCFAYSLYNVW